MSNVVNINIERTGFPVKVGSVELWFDSSVENLRNFFDADELAREKLKIAEEKAKHIHFPADMEDYELDDFTDDDIKNVDAAIDLKSEFIATQYDIIFGDGKFKEIYEVYPDVLALEQALEPLSIAIAKKIEEQEEERSKEVEKTKQEYLNKKKQKK